MPYYPPASSGSAVTVKEVDGTPSVTPVTEIKVSNGTLTDNTGGSVSIATGASGAGTITTVKDEGSTLSSAVTDIDFVGAGVTATGTTSVTVTIPGGSGGVAVAPELVKKYTPNATNGTSAALTLTAHTSGHRMIVVVSSYARDVNTVVCTNVTFTEVGATNFSTGVYMSVYVGVIAGGSSGTTLTVSCTGSNWIVTDVYIVSDTLTPTAGVSATLTDTSAAAVAGAAIGPIAPAIGSFYIIGAAQADGTSGFAAITMNAGDGIAVKITPAANSGLCSAIGRTCAANVYGYTTNGSSGGDFAAIIVAVT